MACLGGGPGSWAMAPGKQVPLPAQPLLPLLADAACSDAPKTLPPRRYAEAKADDGGTGTAAAAPPGPLAEEEVAVAVAEEERVKGTPVAAGGPPPPLPRRCCLGVGVLQSLTGWPFPRRLCRFLDATEAAPEW